MMADRQWFITKIVGALLTVMLLISSCIGAANIIFDIKRDVRGNTESIVEADATSVKFRDKISDEVGELGDDIHSLELVDKELLIHYQELLRRHNESELRDQRILDKLDALEYAGD